MIIPKELSTLIKYNPETGGLAWRNRTSDMFNSGKRSKEAKASIFNAHYADKPALSNKTSEGYLAGTLKKKHLKAHRVAWAIFYGEWPEGIIDHINGDRTDNRICNLRVVTTSQNMMNSDKRAMCSSAFKGVKRDRSSWVASIQSANKPIHIGSFQSEHTASIAYDMFASVLHGEFARPNCDQSTFCRMRDDLTAFIEEWARRNHKDNQAADGLRVWQDREAY